MHLHYKNDRILHMSDSIEITKDKNIRLNFFVDALASGFGWYFHGFGLPKKLLENSKYLNDKNKFSLKSYLLRRKAKKFFDESDEYFQKDIEKMYGFLEEKSELIKKAYSYIPFFTKDNWPYKKLKIIVLPMNSAISDNTGIICLGIRPPEQINNPQISHAIHEMIHLNIKESSESFLSSGDPLQIDAEELCVALITQKICDYMKIENFQKNRLPYSLKKYDVHKNELLNININELINIEQSLHQITNILKKIPVLGT